ncbi:hypothetical protein CU044_6268 [Streptomyces sp. L-9-10]|nr:hypothetical protein CU044_6268 [Streptomyces sp. L-9-10]
MGGRVLETVAGRPGGALVRWKAGAGAGWNGANAVVIPVQRASADGTAPPNE